MLHAADIIANSGQIGAFACSQAAANPLYQLTCGWQAMAGLAIAASTTLLVFMYVLSVMFRNENLKNYVKLEINELFFGAILIIVIVALVAMMADISYASIMPSANNLKDSHGNAIPVDVNVYSVTEEYFNITGDYMSSWMEMNYVMGVYTDSLASATPYPRPMGVGLVASPFAGLASPIKQLLYNMETALAIAYIVNYAQLYVYLFTLAGSLHYFIPIGLFLRCFTPTRRIGGSLVGLGVSFLFIFPLLISLNFVMFYSDAASPMETFRSFTMQRINSQSPGMFGEAMKNFFDQKFTGGFTDFVTAIFGSIGGLITTLIGQAFTLLMVMPISVVGRAFAIGFILPAFDVLMLVQATRYISKHIGEELDISQLTRMI
jgi:hypothetical protein